MFANRYRVYFHFAHNQRFIHYCRQFVALEVEGNIAGWFIRSSNYSVDGVIMSGHLHRTVIQVARRDEGFSAVASENPGFVLMQGRTVFCVFLKKPVYCNWGL